MMLTYQAVKAAVTETLIVNGSANESLASVAGNDQARVKECNRLRAWRATSSPATSSKITCINCVNSEFLLMVFVIL
jgi:hypothetical protein